ncbi:DNA mismatch repair endonuclease MutL [bacterium]|nr:DNA mismatch repair endonuclease MutL [bacterium]
MDAPGPAWQPIAALPQEEVEKISAGEVVERPLSVVKELVENALDAGATQVAIELEDGGKQFIRVTDNGSGIPYGELPLALKPHHTSKIRRLEDLYSLSTLGFRGEALSSIAAVARLTLTSRRGDDELGGRVEASGGALLTHTRHNLQQGTEVEVRDLFFNTPARLKFLRSRQAETSQISALLTSYALAYPEVRWRLESGGRAILRTDGDGDTRAVLSDLLDKTLAEGLAEIHFEFPPGEVTGYISAPHLHWHNRTRQWYFVNRRPVRNKLLYKAVDDSVREFMSAGKFPAGLFFCDLPPEEIDVNVHPMKSEVNFAKPEEVYSLLTTAVRRAVGSAAAKRQRELTRGLAVAVQPAEANEPEKTPPPGAGIPFASEDDPALDPAVPPGLRSIPVYEMGQRIAPTTPSESNPPAELAAEIEFPARRGGEAHEQAQRDDAPQTQGGATADTAIPFPAAPITQIADTYLLIATADEVYLIDQHAAHERILFEELYERLDTARGVAKSRQKLLFPLLVPLSAGEAELVHSYADALKRAGFVASMGAGRNLVVSEVPQILARQVSVELIHGALAELAEHGRSSSLDDQVKELAASLACKAAVKAGDTLPKAERESLVGLILSRWSSLSCPHGRPTVVRLGRTELERLFLR